MLKYGSFGRLLIVAATRCRQAHAHMLLDKVDECLGIAVDVLVGFVKDDQLLVFHRECYVFVVDNSLLQICHGPELYKIRHVFAH